MLPAPAREFPEFPAALAFLPILHPDQVHDLLAARVTAGEDRLAALESGAPPGLPRLFLIEDEYRATMLRAELQWLRTVVADLESRSPHLGRGLIRATLAQFG